MSNRVRFESRRAEAVAPETGPVELPQDDPISVRSHALMLAPAAIALLMLGSYLGSFLTGGVH